MPNPKPHARKAEIASRAWAEALSMSCAVPGSAHRPSGELAAAALRAHGALSAGLGQCVPFTGLGPGGGGVRGLAAFLAVYAGEQEQQGELA
ncbi:hypothetical protein [Streptacidiphilus sp. MAP12-20]|uniref:hypothetical protein n=1 Tax=Streptacidiphilus sp. MAP12-20 TaxID=3156299 RepID=UPI0035179C32